jgi:hypothetical protein
MRQPLGRRRGRVRGPQLRCSGAVIGQRAGGALVLVGVSWKADVLLVQ